MYRTFLKSIITTMTVLGFLFCTMPASSAGEVDLGASLTPKPGASKTAKDQFKKEPPWRIAISMPGVGNSWLVQMLEETKYEAGRHNEISEFIVADAQWNPAKQVADLEDLLTKNPDAIIVYPVTPTSLSGIIDKIAVIIPGTVYQLRLFFGFLPGFRGRNSLPSRHSRRVTKTLISQWATCLRMLADVVCFRRRQPLPQKNPASRL